MYRFLFQRLDEHTVVMSVKVPGRDTIQLDAYEVAIDGCDPLRAAGEALEFYLEREERQDRPFVEEEHKW